MATKLASFTFGMTIFLLFVDTRRGFVEVYGIGKVVMPCLLTINLFS